MKRCDSRWKAEKRKKAVFRILKNMLNTFFNQLVKLWLGNLSLLWHLGGLNVNIYRVHINSVSVGPWVLEILLQPLPQWIGNLVKADELFDPQHLSMVASRARVQSLNDGRDIPKNTGIHESWNGQWRIKVSFIHLTVLNFHWPAEKH